MAFENIIGNEKNKELLKKAIESQNILHSYLFIGEEGIGKSLFATEFAKMILCENEEKKPCNNCKSCIQFMGESHPDFMKIEPEDGKAIKIEQIRFLQEKIAEKPVTSSKKVYIISNSETMTREGANALLKTLEEPPEYAILILLTSNESKLLTTIKSRCTKIYFEKIPEEKILAYLKENGLDTGITENMLKNSEGSIGKALKIEEEKEQYLQIEELVQNLHKQDITQIWRGAEVLYSAKENSISLLEYMTIVFYQLLKKKNELCYEKAIKVIEKTKQRILANANYDMSIDFLLLRLWEELRMTYATD